MRLLKQGCLNFKELFLAKTDFNPFDCITIAAACNQDLRKNRMILNSIASEPLHGWRSAINQSKAAKEWLTWQDHQLCQSALNQLSPEDLEAHDLMVLAYPDHPHPSYRTYVQHAGNQGEYKIPETRYTVDGYHPDTNTVFESRLFLAWLPQMLSCPPRETQAPARSYHVRCLRKDQATDRENPRQRLHHRSDLGM